MVKSLSLRLASLSPGFVTSFAHEGSSSSSGVWLGCVSEVSLGVGDVLLPASPSPPQPAMTKTITAAMTTAMVRGSYPNGCILISIVRTHTIVENEPGLRRPAVCSAHSAGHFGDIGEVFAAPLRYLLLGPVTFGLVGLVFA